MRALIVCKLFPPPPAQKTEKIEQNYFCKYFNASILANLFLLR